ncbi:hypothetical protein FRC02_001329 [Tulasnella sp. 418]|nr:hypothetical protein FRC02_001329 [Tulasnella sp. 418]
MSSVVNLPSLNWDVLLGIVEHEIDVPTLISLRSVSDSISILFALPSHLVPIDLQESLQLRQHQVHMDNRSQKSLQASSDQSPFQQPQYSTLIIVSQSNDVHRSQNSQSPSKLVITHARTPTFLPGCRPTANVLNRIDLVSSAFSISPCPE